MNDIKLLHDEPVNGDASGRSDGLGFTTYSKIIAKTIRGTSGPFTIGIFGEWGTGKTSLLKLIENDFKLNNDIATVWFNAWMYEKEEHPILPLISTIIKEVNKNANFQSGVQSAVKSLIDSLRAVAYGFSTKSTLKMPGFAEIEASFVAKDMIDRASAITDDPLLDKAIYYNSFERLSNIKIPTDKKIVIFIDDLDRCFPDKAIKLLESIKLVLSQHGFIFVLAVAREIIEGYLTYKYNKEFGIEKFEGIKYLDKIIQLSFPIPPHTQRISDFSTVLLNQLSIEDRETFSPIMQLVGIFCDYNPRGAVRFINNLLIDSAINKELCSECESELIGIEYFAITRGMQLRWPFLFFKLSTSKELCDELSKIDLHSIDNNLITDNKELLEFIDAIKLDSNLQTIISTSQFKNWVANHNSRNFAIAFLRTRLDENKKFNSSLLRVRDIAAELDISSKELMTMCRECKIPVKSHMGMLSEHDIQTLKNYYYNNLKNNVISKNNNNMNKDILIRRKINKRK